MQLIKKIQNFAFQNKLWEKGSKIVLGVSGGPDSVCLLDILYKLSKKYDFKLHIIHVNYNLRGRDSEKDEKFVRELGKKYGIATSCYSPSKKEYQGNLENNLRNIRYDYFEKIRKELGFNLIAVAHNQDDQAETVLMRIIRGTGLQGLAAMRAKNEPASTREDDRSSTRGGKIIRPLLDISRREILDYLKREKLKYRIDKSNASTKFQRNKIRHGLLPYLEKNFNPNIKKTLSEWSKVVADDYAFIEKSAEKLRKDFNKNKKFVFSADYFNGLCPAMQRQLLRIMHKNLKFECPAFVARVREANNLDLENKQIEEIIKVIKSTKSKDQKAKIGGLNILKKNGIVFLRIMNF
ncbi:MAG TPA: tRNA lysidine(34) synthetase TilS [Candidatus Moranbacteria bacterium]|nr:tRNA lysidine(34) synthetase TilS [Candidatus Moranbacteria bacterium]